MHVRYFDDNVVFFWIESIRSPGACCDSNFYFARPISWPKRNVKIVSPLGLASTLMPQRCAFMISVTMASRRPGTAVM
jgi:hypothetical protein